MTPGKIIMFAITASLAINGVAVTFTTSAISTQSVIIQEQSAAMSELTLLVYAKMDDRYRRKEAEGAHNSIKDRIRAVEKRDDILEGKLDSHVSDDG